MNILFQSRPGRLQHLLLKRVPGSSAVAALHPRKSSEIKPGCSSVQEKKSLRTYLFSNFSYIHGSVHWGGRGAVLCLQRHLSASSHQLCPPTGRDAAPDSFSAKGGIRPSIGSGRFTKSSLPIGKKQHKKRLKITATAGVLRTGARRGQRSGQRGRGRGEGAGQVGRAPAGSPGWLGVRGRAGGSGRARHGLVPWLGSLS